MSLLAVRTKEIAADMGNGLIVIAGVLLAITILFLMVMVQWKTVNNNACQTVYSDKPVIESTLEETGTVSVVVP